MIKNELFAKHYKINIKITNDHTYKKYILINKLNYRLPNFNICYFILNNNILG